MTQLAFEWPLDMVADREQIREMEIRTYGCGKRPEFHDPHQVDRDGRTYICPGLTTQKCGQQAGHVHHRWATPDSFHWCDGRPKKASLPGDAIRPVRTGLKASPPSDAKALWINPQSVT